MAFQVRRTSVPHDPVGLRVHCEVILVFSGHLLSLITIPIEPYGNKLSDIAEAGEPETHWTAVQVAQKRRGTVNSKRLLKIEEEDCGPKLFFSFAWSRERY